MSRRPKGRGSLVQVLLTILIVLMIAVTGMILYLCLNMAGPSGQNQVQSGPAQTQTLPPQTEPTTEPPPPETTLPEPEHVVSTARLGFMGDLLMHTPLFLAKYNSTVPQGDGSYDFSPIFQYIREDLQPLDFTAANLETTLCGTDNGYEYSGFPHFNCPDDIVPAAKDAGFDMLLTVNNHSYDTGLVGYKRTLETVRAGGLGTLGTMLNPEEPKYTIETVNDIAIGMVAYTYATSATGDGRPSLNGNAAMSEAGICNYFTYENLPAFYDEAAKYLAEMKDAGAEAAIIFLHWGVEYRTEPNDTQKAMAQKLCDLGFDVIVGGHPHVVEPVDLLQSTVDPDHYTPIIYSLGNAVSNQQREAISSLCPTGHSEDGVLFTVGFEKYSDGTVYLSEIDGLKTCVRRFNNDAGKLEYNILPLHEDAKDTWAERFGLNANALQRAQGSFDRTSAIIDAGVEKCQTYLADQKEARDQRYYELAMNPDLAVSVPTETQAQVDAAA